MALQQLLCALLRSRSRDEAADQSPWDRNPGQRCLNDYCGPALVERTSVRVGGGCYAAVGGAWLRRMWRPSGLRASVVPSGCRMICQPHRWMQTSWWNWHMRTHSRTLVWPPCFLCLDVVDVARSGVARPQRGQAHRRVAQQDRAADVGGDVLGVADVQGEAGGAVAGRPAGRCAAPRRACRGRTRSRWRAGRSRAAARRAPARTAWNGRRWSLGLGSAPLPSPARSLSPSVPLPSPSLITAYAVAVAVGAAGAEAGVAAGVAVAASPPPWPSAVPRSPPWA